MDVSEIEKELAHLKKDIERYKRQEASRESIAWFVENCIPEGEELPYYVEEIEIAE